MSCGAKGRSCTAESLGRSTSRLSAEDSDISPDHGRSNRPGRGVELNKQWLDKASYQKSALDHISAPQHRSADALPAVVMIAERAADLIRGQQPLPPAEAPVWINPKWERAQR